MEETVKTKFDDLVMMGAMSQVEAENLEVMIQALDLIEGIGPRVERDREMNTGELDPLPRED